MSEPGRLGRVGLPLCRRCMLEVVVGPAASPASSSTPAGGPAMAALADRTLVVFSDATAQRATDARGVQPVVDARHLIAVQLCRGRVGARSREGRGWAGRLADCLGDDGRWSGSPAGTRSPGPCLRPACLLAGRCHHLGQAAHGQPKHEHAWVGGWVEGGRCGVRRASPAAAGSSGVRLQACVFDNRQCRSQQPSGLERTHGNDQAVYQTLQRVHRNNVACISRGWEGRDGGGDSWLRCLLARRRLLAAAQPALLVG